MIREQGQMSVATQEREFEEAMDRVKAEMHAVQARMKELAEAEVMTKEIARLEADYTLLIQTT
jgi:hypothetical protein